MFSADGVGFVFAPVLPWLISLGAGFQEAEKTELGDYDDRRKRVCIFDRILQGYGGLTGFYDTTLKRTAVLREGGRRRLPGAQLSFSA